MKIKMGEELLRYNHYNALTRYIERCEKMSGDILVSNMFLLRKTSNSICGKEVTPNHKFLSFACMSALLHSKNNKSCLNCPIVWNKAWCRSEGSLYNQFLNAKNLKQKKEIAKLIYQLPWRGIKSPEKVNLKDFIGIKDESSSKKSSK